MCIRTLPVLFRKWHLHMRTNTNLLLCVYVHRLSYSASGICTCAQTDVDCVWNVMAHTQKPDFVFRRNGRVNLNRRGRQFIRLLAAEVCASAVVMVVMLDTPFPEVVWRVLATHSIRQFLLHFPSRPSPCAITLQLLVTRCRALEVNVEAGGLWFAFQNPSDWHQQNGRLWFPDCDWGHKIDLQLDAGKSFCTIHLLCYWINVWGI